jgi:hypothetical protein
MWLRTQWIMMNALTHEPTHELTHELTHGWSSTPPGKNTG